MTRKGWSHHPPSSHHHHHPHHPHHPHHHYHPHHYHHPHHHHHHHHHPPPCIPNLLRQLYTLHHPPQRPRCWHVSFLMMRQPSHWPPRTLSPSCSWALPSPWPWAWPASGQSDNCETYVSNIQLRHIKHSDAIHISLQDLLNTTIQLHLQP